MGDESNVSGPALLRVPEFVLRERVSMLGTDRGYDLFTVDGAALGAIRKEPSAGSFFFGKWADNRWHVTDETGGPVATLFHRGKLGRMSFQVLVGERSIGTVAQENHFFAPQLTVTSASGATWRLTGGSFGSPRALSTVDGAQQLGTSVREKKLRSLFGGADTYRVSLVPALTGEDRLLAALATACVDLVVNAKQNDSNGAVISG